MLKTKSHDSAKNVVEAEVIETIERQGFNLNIVNNYDENLLHISAANGCYEIARKILEWKESCRVIDRKNKFGWTPLMQAIRNGDIDTVKLLLEKNSSVNQSTYLGMSVLGLAAAISKEMFETVYNACPNALANTVGDDISPLCVAAMKNDKELFFKLLELGMPLSSANEYTHIMMRSSTVPEIAGLAKEEDLITEDYWNDTSDNIQVTSEQDVGERMSATIEMSRREAPNDGGDSKPILTNEGKGKRQPAELRLLYVPAEFEKPDLLSPALTYNRDEIFASSPIARFAKTEDLAKNSSTPLDERNANKDSAGDDSGDNSTITDECQFESPPITLRRARSVRPADFDVSNLSDDLNVTLGFTPEFSPLRSPHVPPDINNEENVFGENTPTPPRCRTPPKGALLNSQLARMVVVLRRYGLNRHVPVFLEQEVDVDLFLTLTNSDLIEIGIEHEEDRCALLEAIKKYKIDLKYDNI